MAPINNASDVKDLNAIPFHPTSSGFFPFGSVLSTTKKFFLSGLPSKQDLIIFLLSGLENRHAFAFRINGPAIGAKETYQAQYTDYISRLPIDYETKWFDITFLAEKQIATRNRTKAAFVTNIVLEEICAQSAANLLPEKSDKSFSLFNSSILIKHSETAKRWIFDEFGLVNEQEQQRDVVDNRIDYQHVQQTATEHQSPPQINQSPVDFEEDTEFDHRLQNYLYFGALNTPSGPSVIPTPKTTSIFFDTFDSDRQQFTNMTIKSNAPLSQSIPIVSEEHEQPISFAQKSLKRKLSPETATEMWMSENMERLKNLEKKFQETMSEMIEHVNQSKNEVEERECSMQETSEMICNQMVQLDQRAKQTEERLLYLIQKEQRISQLEGTIMQNEQMLQQRIAEFEQTKSETEQSFEQQRKKIKQCQVDSEARKMTEESEIAKMEIQKKSLIQEINAIQETKERLTLENASLEQSITSKKQNFLKIQEILSNF